MKSITIRFEDETYARLKQQAKAEKRSINSCVAVAVEKNFNHLSNCCSSPIIEHTDLCSKCKEHCEIKE